MLSYYANCLRLPTQKARMMIEKHYLLKVLGLSGIPKLITFGITLFSFPLLIRSLGATEYGVVLTIGAALGLFEVLIYFGVTAASGKSMASIRAHHPLAIRSEFFAWARLQAFFVLIGFAPMMLAAWLVLQGNVALQFKPELLYVMGATIISQVVITFIKVNLTSLLAFKSLAVLDTIESVLRSGGYLVVAFLHPSAIGLVLAGLGTSVAVAGLALVMISQQLSLNATDEANNQKSHMPLLPMSVKSRLKDSLHFLWLGLSTRLFQQGPLLIIGRLMGLELVGIVGAFSKISEIISTPYLVIGNALMVRVNEISGKGKHALQTLWDTAFRIMSTALLFVAMVFLGASPLAHALLPASPKAPMLFSILAWMVIATSTFSLVAPMSDYMGGLFTRNMLLTSAAIIQLPILWVSTQLFGAQGAVFTYVFVFVALAAGYVLIASKVFFDKYTPPLRQELMIFSGLVFFTLLAVEQLKQLPFMQVLLPPNDSFFVYVKISIFLSVVGIGLWLNKRTRAFYFNSNFFEFAHEIKAN